MLKARGGAPLGAGRASKVAAKAMVRAASRNWPGRRNHFGLPCSRSSALLAAERDDGLDRSVAERARAHDRGALVVLQRSRQDFRAGCRPAVDQHDNRFALGEIAGLGGEALGVIGIAPARRNDLTLF